MRRIFFWAGLALWLFSCNSSNSGSGRSADSTTDANRSGTTATGRDTGSMNGGGVNGGPVTNGVGPNGNTGGITNAGAGDTTHQIKGGTAGGSGTPQQ